MPCAVCIPILQEAVANESHLDFAGGEEVEPVQEVQDAHVPGDESTRERRPLEVLHRCSEDAECLLLPHGYDEASAVPPCRTGCRKSKDNWNALPSAHKTVRKPGKQPPCWCSRGTMLVETHLQCVHSLRIRLPHQAGDVRGYGRCRG